MRSLNLANVEAKTGGGSFPSIEPGGYICRITKVEDVPEKEYLKVNLDIATGEYKDFYKNMEARTNRWGCTQYWSYKEVNLPYFKGNIEAVEKSAQGKYNFSDQSEQELVGKLIGAVFGEEEYMGNDGEIRTNVRPRFVCSVQRIMDRDFSIPKKKLYDPAKDRRNRQNPAWERRSSYIDPIPKDAGGLPDDLDAWAEAQKLPWE